MMRTTEQPGRSSLGQVWAKCLLTLAAVAPFTMAGTATAQQRETSGAVFALIDKNEWCPAGSVYLDMRAGRFMLHPRTARPACNEASRIATIENGTLAAPDFQEVRVAYRNARLAGLRRDRCDLIVSNGGHEVLVITAAGFSAATPVEEGCWSKEAIALHELLYKLFGSERQPAR